MSHTSPLKPFPNAIESSRTLSPAGNSRCVTATTKSFRKVLKSPPWARSQPLGPHERKCLEEPKLFVLSDVTDLLGRRKVPRITVTEVVEQYFSDKSAEQGSQDRRSIDQFVESCSKKHIDKIGKQGVKKVMGWLWLHPVSQCRNSNFGQIYAVLWPSIRGWKYRRHDFW